MALVSSKSTNADIQCINDLESQIEKYMNYEIFPNEELNSFINNGFIPDNEIKERRYRTKSTNLTKIGLIVTIVAIFISLLLKFCYKDIDNETKRVSKTGIIYNDSILTDTLKQEEKQKTEIIK